MHGLGWASPSAEQERDARLARFQSLIDGDQYGRVAPLDVAEVICRALRLLRLSYTLRAPAKDRLGASVHPLSPEAAAFSPGAAVVRACHDLALTYAEGTAARLAIEIQIGERLRLWAAVRGRTIDEVERAFLHALHFTRRAASMEIAA